MPLNFLGQLNPTMQQQIALQKALLALQREDEKLRRRAQPQQQSALGQQLGGGGLTGGFGSSIKGPGEPKTDWNAEADRRMMERDRASAIQLRAAQPTPGYQDPQEKAWARRAEMVAEREGKMNNEADALYGMIQTLEKKDQDIILEKIAGKERSATSLSKALGAAPGTISPAAVSADPLLKAMIDKNYIKQTKSGYAWMLPEKEKKPISTTKIIDEQGWSHLITSYPDGTVHDELLGREAKEPVEEKGLTPSETLSYQKYADELSGKDKEQSDKNMAKAIDMAGLRLGVGERDSNGKKWSQEDDNNWNERVLNNKAKLDELYGVGPKLPTGDLSLDNIPDSSPDVIKRKEDIAIMKARAEDDPEYIGMIEITLGLPITKQWSPQLEYMLYQYNIGGM